MFVDFFLHHHIFKRVPLLRVGRGLGGVFGEFMCDSSGGLVCFQGGRAVPQINVPHINTYHLYLQQHLFHVLMKPSSPPEGFSHISFFCGGFSNQEPLEPNFATSPYLEMKVTSFVKTVKCKC